MEALGADSGAAIKKYSLTNYLINVWTAKHTASGKSRRATSYTVRTDNTHSLHYMLVAGCASELAEHLDDQLIEEKRSQ